MTYRECTEWMFSQLPMYQRQGKAAYKANLDNTWALMDLLNHPYKNFKSVHIAGTNGKGSVAHLMASAFQEAGFNTGLYTSPHLIDFRERIKVNGQMITEEEVLKFIGHNKKVFENIEPSFFEMTVGMAFWYFELKQVDIAVIETGMGGRLDSTNVILPILSVITNIGMDHQQFLGNTIEKIALEKAGIIKPTIPVLIGETQKETESVFIKKALEMKSPIEFADKDYRIEKQSDQFLIQADLLKLSMRVPLYGNYQQKNILTAFAACRAIELDLEHIMLGFNNILSNTHFRGRYEHLSLNKRVICDMAHNEDGLKIVLKQLLNEDYANLHIVLGVVSDKSLKNILALFPTNATYYFCKANIPRGLNENTLLAHAKEYKLTGRSYASVAAAFDNAINNADKKDLIFVGGSTFTVAEVLQNNDQL
jgi:dihydrofolate synthase/folylpolyglutamate synthase